MYTPVLLPSGTKDTLSLGENRISFMIHVEHEHINSTGPKKIVQVQWRTARPGHPPIGIFIMRIFRKSSDDYIRLAAFAMDHSSCEDKSND